VLLMAGLWIAAAALYVGYGRENRDAFLWIALLLIQSLPYLAALVTSMTVAMPDLLAIRQRRTRTVGAPAQASD